MKIIRITPVSVEYNPWNGLFFEILGLDMTSEKINIDGALFGVDISQDYLQLSVFYKASEIRLGKHI